MTALGFAADDPGHGVQAISHDRGVVEHEGAGLRNPE